MDEITEEQIRAWLMQCACAGWVIDTATRDLVDHVTGARVPMSNWAAWVRLDRVPTPPSGGYRQAVTHEGT